MRFSALAGFRVAGLDDESQEFTQPVKVTCACGEASGPFTFRRDGGADMTALLGDLVQWAWGHECATVRDSGEDDRR